MSVKPRARGGGFKGAAALAASAAMAGLSAGGGMGEPFTWQQLTRLPAVAEADFPQVLGSRVIRARFQEKRTFTLADGSRQTLFLFRAANCWLREKTAASRAAIDCRTGIGPGVFIAVLFVTPASAPGPAEAAPAELVLTSRSGTSLADYVPQDRPRGTRRGVSAAAPRWIALTDPAADSLSLSAPPVPAALVVCVPSSAQECRAGAAVLLANLAGAKGPAVPAPARPAAPPPGVLPQPGALPQPADGEAAAAAPEGAEPAPPPGLRYAIRPAAGAIPEGWTAERLARRLIALVPAAPGAFPLGRGFYLRTGDGAEVPTSRAPELTVSGDAVVAWSGDDPAGPGEGGAAKEGAREGAGQAAAGIVLRGIEGVEVRPVPEGAGAAAASGQSPPAGAGDALVAGEFKIAPAFLYDQWQAGIELAAKVYGRDELRPFDDRCRYALVLPGTGSISYLQRTMSLGLVPGEQAGRRTLVSQQAIRPAQLARGAGTPLQLEVHAPNFGPAGCPGERAKLAAFAPGKGAWRLSGLPGDPSTGRMRIRTSGLAIPGRWLLGLYGPGNVEGGALAPSVQDRIVRSLMAFLDGLRERYFENVPPADAAVGADLAVMDALGGASATFSQRSVIAGKFRQPPMQNGLFRPDPEAGRRLNALLPGPADAGTGVSFRSVGRTIMRYADLFGKFSGSPPIAVYVGTARPLPGTCAQWRDMTAEVARLSGRPRVFAVVFADAAADEIARRLGERGRGANEPARPAPAATCEGEGGSVLLFVPVSDLVTDTPEAALQGAFAALERRAASVRN